MAKMKEHHKDMKVFDGWRWIQLFWMNAFDGKIAFSRLLEGLVVQSLGLPGLSLGFPSWMDDEKTHISDPWDERYTYVEPTNWRQI